MSHSLLTRGIPRSVGHDSRTRYVAQLRMQLKGKSCPTTWVMSQRVMSHVFLEKQLTRGTWHKNKSRVMSPDMGHLNKISSGNPTSRVPQTSRANPVQCYRSCSASGRASHESCPTTRVMSHSLLRRGIPDQRDMTHERGMLHSWVCNLRTSHLSRHESCPTTWVMSHSLWHEEYQIRGTWLTNKVYCTVENVT